MSALRRLHLLRHAAAAWPAPGGNDHGRPLDRQGRDEAAALAEVLEGRRIVYDAVACSGALRTRETLAALRPASLRAAPVFDDSLYEAGTDAYASALAAMRGETGLIVGHNPTIGAFALSLARQGNPAALQRLRAGFPTCGLAIFRMGEDGAAFLEELLHPLDAA